VGKASRIPYRLDPQPLGKGSYAFVHRGVHRETGQEAAIKQPLRRDTTALDRFKREVEVQSQLNHPHVMPLLEYSVEDRWLAMPLAHRSLTTAVEKDRDIDSWQLVGIIKQLALALGHAHERGFVHRDVNPNNMLEVRSLSPRGWMMADWGLVRRPRGKSSPRLTRKGQALGTEGFIAPETEDDAHAADPPCDIFSLGRVAHFALVNVWPRQGFPLPDPGWLWSDFVEQCTAVRDERFSSMKDVLAAIRRMELHLRQMEVEAERLICPRCGNEIRGARCEICGTVWD
jgi:serine/threonine protein kinase